MVCASPRPRQLRLAALLFCVHNAAVGAAPSLLDQLAVAELRAAHALSEVASVRTQLQQQQQQQQQRSEAASGTEGAAIDAEVQELIDQMTLPEKARQLDIWRTSDILTNGKIDKSKAVTHWGDLAAGVGVLHDVYPYAQISNEIMSFILNASRLKIPPLFGGEATHGLQMDDHTIFPSPISLAATWDKALLRSYGGVVASEARACGTHITWSPVLGLCREPRWGRCEEMMGECTHLAAELGRAAIEGLTSHKNLIADDAVAPLLKHYLAYSAPEGGHNTAPAHVGRRELLTTFLPPFSAGMEAGAQAMMVSYNEVDGEPNAQSSYVLTELPRKQLGGNGPQGVPWDGFVSSDFGAINRLLNGHKTVHNSMEAIAAYINAGGSVQGFDFDHKTWQDGVVGGVKSGLLPEAALDLAVSRVLKVKVRLGLMKHPLVPDTSLYHKRVTSPEHEQVALDAARKAMVLLQNEPDTALGSHQPILPFDPKKLSSLAVLGPNADQPQCGDYSAGGSWGGDVCGGGPINNKRTSSVLGGIKQVAPHLKLTYAPGVSIADFNANASYYTTVQSHSFTTLQGEPGLIGSYYASKDASGTVLLRRNDFMLSFHFLNYGPGQSEADPSVFPQSAFSAVWEGHLTPDITVTGALFSVKGRGDPVSNYSLMLGEKVVLVKDPETHKSVGSPVDLVRGQKMKLRFQYYQPDSTGQHPAFALQWSVQGASPLTDAIHALQSTDAAVLVCGGGTSVTSGEGVDRASLGLPGGQLAFIQAVHAAAVVARKPLAVVVVQGKAFGEVWMKQTLPAILEGWQAGQAQGRAIAETLFGLNNPAGRTAVSFPVSADVLPVFYNYHPSASRGGYHNPPIIPGGSYPPTSPTSASILWAFGHGLSYGATFHYSDLKLDPATVGLKGKVKVSFTVTNNGTAAAEEVAQLYVRDEVASVATAIKQLRNFTRLPAIDVGKSVAVEMELDVQRDLWLVDLNYNKVVEAGEFTIAVGGASDKTQQNAVLMVTAE